MTGRRWRDGWSRRIDGISFRIVRGRKGPNDLRLDWYVDGQWRPIHMRIAALLTDFFYENEDVLYPPPAKGGQKILDYLRWAAKNGWEKAEAGLRAERELKRARPVLFDDIYDVFDEDGTP